MLPVQSQDFRVRKRLPSDQVVMVLRRLLVFGLQYHSASFRSECISHLPLQQQDVQALRDSNHDPCSVWTFIYKLFPLQTYH